VEEKKILLTPQGNWEVSRKDWKKETFRKRGKKKAVFNGIRRMYKGLRVPDPVFRGVRERTLKRKGFVGPKERLNQSLTDITDRKTKHGGKKKGGRLWFQPGGVTQGAE